MRTLSTAETDRLVSRSMQRRVVALDRKSSASVKRVVLCDNNKTLVVTMSNGDVHKVHRHVHKLHHLRLLVIAVMIFNAVWLVADGMWALSPIVTGIWLGFLSEWDRFDEKASRITHWLENVGGYVIDDLDRYL